MLWTVRHEWPSGARFVFNCYKHHYNILVIRNNNGTLCVTASKEGVTQGDPLAMIAYGLGLLPLIRQLKTEFLHAFQPWYADDSAVAAKFDVIQALYNRLYFAEPTKSILIVAEHNIEKAKEYFADLGFKIKTGSRYLGGFIGEETARAEWLQSEIDEWTNAVHLLAAAANKYPQSAYAAIQKSLQQRGQYVQRVCNGIGNSFGAVQEAITGSFLPSLFGETSMDNSDICIRLAGLPVKHAGLAILDPTESSEVNFEASAACIAHLIKAIKGEGKFRTGDHLVITL